MEEDFGLIMPFKDQSNSFTFGFECGQIWEQLKATKPFDHYLFHVSNKEQVEMMCRRFHYSFMIESSDDTWCYLTASIDKTLAN